MDLPSVEELDNLPENTLFKLTRTFSDSWLLFLINHQERGILKQWYSLDEELKARYFETLTAIEKKLYELEWHSGTEISFKHFSSQLKFQLSPSGTACFASINGEMCVLKQLHLVLSSPKLFPMPKMKQLIVYGINKHKQVVTQTFSPDDFLKKRK